MFTVLLSPHPPLPVEPSRVAPQFSERTYCALTEWQPGTLVLGAASYKPPSILYSTSNPAIAGTLGSENDIPHVFDVAVITGAVGKITAFPDVLTQFGISAAVDPQASSFIHLICIS